MAVLDVCLMSSYLLEIVVSMDPCSSKALVLCKQILILWALPTRSYSYGYDDHFVDIENKIAGHTGLYSDNSGQLFVPSVCCLFPCISAY